MPNDPFFFHQIEVVGYEFVDWGLDLGLTNHANNHVKDLSPHRVTSYTIARTVLLMT